MLGRSDGYGSLQIWLRYFRNGIHFQRTYQSATGCSAQRSGWSGSAILIDGAWQWRDVSAVAKKNNVIVVTGGSVAVGAIGGFPSGGGHGPASRNFGMGADQILEAKVMLADGRIVIANHCQNTDLLRAIRGGGPGYGVVLGTTVKAHPNVDIITVHNLIIAPHENTEENAALLDAMAIMMQSYPALNAAGYCGYGWWYRKTRDVLFNNATSGYSHGIWTMGQTREESEAAFAPVRARLAQLEDKLFISETYLTYSSYWSFYETEMALYDPAGVSWALTSRMITPEAVQDYGRVRETVEIVSGGPEEYAGNVVLMSSGGQVYEDAKDTTSGLHPAWRTSPYVLVTFRNPANNATNAQRAAINHDITYVKGAALKRLSPGTGAYMNEADRNDPDYIETFYGTVNYQSHLAAKNKYDSQHTFYCPTCVGAEAWIDRPDGPLCRA
jgi:FAD/FMN-containing dehydrogenase